jgi:hypothetical protein
MLREILGGSEGLLLHAIRISTYECNCLTRGDFGSLLADAIISQLTSSSAEFESPHKASLPNLGGRLRARNQ